MTLERHYAAVAFVGQHSMADVRGGVMSHSYSSLGIQTMRVNGKAMGEIETRTALAGAFGTPVIFLSGDTAAAEELRAIVPGAETVAVKKGSPVYVPLEVGRGGAGRHARACPARRREDRRHPALSDRGAGDGGDRVHDAEFTAGRRERAPGREVVDDRTIRYHGKDFLEAWTRYSLF